MRYIDNSINLIEFIKENDSNCFGKLTLFDLPCTSQSDLLLYNDMLKKLSNDSIITYNESNGDILYQIDRFNNYIQFYELRKKLNQLIAFILQGIRDAFCVEYFKKYLFSTLIARETMSSCIYNFSSAVSININKIFVESNGKYYIENIACLVRNYLKNNSLNKELDKSKELKKQFSLYKKTINEKINEFNEYRNTLFAHSDKDTMLKVENVDIKSSYNMFIECLKYAISLVNLIDEDKMNFKEEKINIKNIDLEANYFVSQLIRK